jgi:hypothetical protein
MEDKKWLTVINAISDIVDDPENPFYTLAHWHEDGVKFNAPVAQEVADVLKIDGLEVEVLTEYELYWG